MLSFKNLFSKSIHKKVDLTEGQDCNSLEFWLGTIFEILV